MTYHGITGACLAGGTRQRKPPRFAPAGPGPAQCLAGAHGGALACLLTITLVLSVSMGGCAMTAAGTGAPSPDSETLNARFRALAYEQLSFRLERSRPLSPPAQRAIEEFISAGARRLEADGATAQGVATAEANLERFVARLSEDADSGEQGDITAATVEATRHRLCPLYPFC